jgi:alcohol dehydrogenase
LELARTLGAQHTIEPKSCDVVARIAELTAGGVDFAFEAVGSAAVLATAYESVRRGGSAISIGLPHPNQQLSIQAVSLVGQEKTLRGSYMGSAVPKRDIPRFIALYQDGRLPVDALLSPPLRFDEINVGFDRLAAGTAVRQILSPA